MALLHQAEVVPSKLELLQAWAPSQTWFVGEPGVALVNVSSYRFDDPDGEVGIETLLIRAGEGPVMQVPLTYRGAPLEGGDSWLVGTMQHSVLGPRWVYDALGDPVALAAFATTALTGGHQAEQWIEIDGVMVQRDPTAVVEGSGVATSGVVLPLGVDIRNIHATESSTALAGDLTLTIQRVLEPGRVVAAQATLSGTWRDQPAATTLATVELA
jgi:hypothetical protein